MKKTFLGLALISTLALSGCANNVSSSTLDGYQIDQSAVASIFPASAVIKDAGENMYVLLPCDINNALSEAGATVASSAGLDIRDESEKETYYDVIVTKYSIDDKFPDLKKVLTPALDECVSSTTKTIGNQTHFNNSDVELSTRDLKSLGIAGDNVVQFTNVESSLLTVQLRSGEIKMPESDATNYEVYVAKTDKEIFVLSVNGRHYESNSSDFLYYKELADTVFNGFAAK